MQTISWTSETYINRQKVYRISQFQSLPGYLSLKLQSHYLFEPLQMLSSLLPDLACLSALFAKLKSSFHEYRVCYDFYLLDCSTVA